MVYVRFCLCDYLCASSFCCRSLWVCVYLCVIIASFSGCCAHMIWFSLSTEKRPAEQQERPPTPPRRRDPKMDVRDLNQKIILPVLKSLKEIDSVSFRSH